MAQPKRNSEKAIAHNPSDPGAIDRNPAASSADVIRDALQRNMLLFGTVSDAVMVVGRDGRIAEWNPAAERIFGYSRAEIQGRSPLQLHPFEGAEALGSEITGAVETRGKWIGAIETVRQDGHNVFCGVTVLPLHDEAGERIANVWVARDLTDRRVASRQMLAQESRFQSLLENIHDIVAVLDPEGRIRYVSPSVQRSLGHSPEDLMGEAVIRFVHSADRHSIGPRFTRALAKPGAEVSWEVRVRHKDRSWRFLEIDARNLTADPSVRGLIVTARDATLRKQSEAALRANEARFRAIFDQAAVGVTLIDLAGRPILVNNALQRMLGYTPDQLSTMSLDDLIHPDEVRAGWRLFERLVTQTISVFQRDVRLIHRDGRVIWTHVGVSALNPSDNGLPHAIAIVQDITERREAEITLLQREEQLRQSQKMEAVGRLAGGIAHDYNNMLTVIRSFAELLRMDLEPGSELIDYAEQIMGAAERSAGLTRQLLAFSRRQVLQPEVLDLNSIVGRLETMLRRLIGEDITLVAILEPELPPIHADPGQIEQVLMNLIVNARDAMPKGGHVSIRTRIIRTFAPRRVEGGELQPGEYIRLSVEDAGTGIDTEGKSRLFEPFYTTKPHGHGTGLGLATVYGIVDQSGGYVEVESTLGAGSTFHVYLPPTRKKPSEEEGDEQDLRRQRGTETVLLVEDEPSVRNLASLVLEQAGYRVIEASSGHDALELVEQCEEPPLLLLSDVVMPDMSGQTLARELVSTHPDLRIVFMSGYNEEAISRHGVLHDGAAFIEKPFTPDSLLRTIRASLDGT